MFRFSVLYKAVLFLICICICTQSLEAQSKKGKKDNADPYMHISFESPLWISDPNTLDDSHKAGFGFRANFPINSSPWNLLIGYSQYNYGNHINRIDITNSGSVMGAEGTIQFREGTYEIKYASLPLGLKYDKKFWSASFDVQFLFNLNQAEMHTSEINFNFGTEDFEDFAKEKLNRVNSALTFSFEGKLPIGDRWSIYLEPEFQFLLSPVFKNAIDNVNRSNLFLKVGLRHLILLPTPQVEARK